MPDSFDNKTLQDLVAKVARLTERIDSFIVYALENVASTTKEITAVSTRVEDHRKANETRFASLETSRERVLGLLVGAAVAGGGGAAVILERFFG